MRRFVAGVALAVLAAGCSCGGPTTVHELYVDEINVLCSFYARCGLIGKSEESTCNSNGLEFFETYSTSLSSYDINAAVTAGRLSIDSSAANQCFGGFKSASCNGSGTLALVSATCQRVYVGHVSLGSSCQSSLECSNGTCQLTTTGNMCNGVCVAFAAENASCGTLQCDPRQDFCSSVCKPRGAVGATCSATSFGEDCQLGLGCVDSKCAGPGGAGMSCSNGACVNGYHCVTTSGSGGVCAANVGSGQACPDPAACPDGERCVGSNGGGAGTCSPIVDVGSACDPSADLCPIDAACDPTSHTCGTSTPTKEGAACTTTCSVVTIFSAPLYCDPATSKCAKKLLPGAACTPATAGGDEPCATTCGATTHVCDPAPVSCF